ncbi:MAG: extracellular solute-binding protein [Treponema sp.]|jgi:multiple sugar transport system substrate-binding protein|nr:extracellular solute-binding protein [Treponema sp.]
MKKFCLFLMTVLLLCCAITGCKKEKAAGAGPVNIIYYTWDDPSIKPIIETFNASQDEIFVDAQYLPQPDYEVKITTLLTGRTPMDAYMQKRQVDMFPHYKNGFIEPLDNLLAKTGINRTAVDAYKNSISVDGKVIAFPWRGAAYYTYYNKKIFAAKNVPTPDTYVKAGTWTWDKFAEVAKQLSSGDGKVYGASVYHWGSSQLIMETQNQKSVISADGKLNYDGAILRWLSMRKKMEENKSCWPLIDMKVTSTHYSKQFYDGQAAMLLIGEWFPGQIQSGRDQGVLVGWGWNDWGLTRLPCDVSPYVTMGAPTFSHVTSYSKNKEAAFKFIAWMGGPEGSKIAAKAGVLPAMVDDGVKQVLAEVIPDPQSLDYFVEKKIAFPMAYNKYGSRIENLINTVQEEYLLGKIPDGQFDAYLRAGLEEIIKTTD